MRPPPIPVRMNSLPVIYLKSEEIYIAQKPSIITTVLGSCIAVTMYSARWNVGAMCHALLPLCRERDGCGECQTRKYKYVECVIPEMLRLLAKRKIDPKELEVKLFGGSDMTMPKSKKPDIHAVGKQNTEAAVKTIRLHHLNLVKSDTGGDFGRKIFFLTNTGKILLKRLAK